MSPTLRQARTLWALRELFEPLPFAWPSRIYDWELG